MFDEPRGGRLGIGHHVQLSIDEAETIEPHAQHEGRNQTGAAAEATHRDEDPHGQAERPHADGDQYASELGDAVLQQQSAEEETERCSRCDFNRAIDSDTRDRLPGPHAAARREPGPQRVASELAARHEHREAVGGAPVQGQPEQ